MGDLVEFELFCNKCGKAKKIRLSKEAHKELKKALKKAEGK